jgi:type I restriction enzyme S subunit
MSKPKIRFKGYEEDWEQRKLSDITLKIGSGKTPSGGKNAYVDDGIPLIRSQNINNDRVDLEDIVFIDEETDNSMENSRVFTDDVLLNITGASIGRSAVYRGKDKANVNQHVCIIRPTKDFDSDFIQLNLASNFGQKQIDASQAGGGREGLNFQEIGKMSFMFPSNQEQMKIGVYFNHIDYLITLHQRKCEETKKLKKYMLQKMFPQNGKRVPEIRFVGFTEDWEQRKVKEFAIESEVKGHSGKDAKKLTVKLHNKGVYVADEKIQGSDNTQYYIRRAGQFIYGKQNFFNGAIGIVPKKLDKYESTKDVPAFDVSSDVNVDWLYYYIARPEIYKPQEALCTGTGSKRFHVNNFYNLSLAIPKMDEQIKIKEYFVHLDNLITLHQRKYEELQKIKKFMLQNMFI